MSKTLVACRKSNGEVQEFHLRVLLDLKRDPPQTSNGCARVYFAATRVSDNSIRIELSVANEFK